ncbi:hypothetical protein MPSEU_000427500 [Mayamaea pseudoterrestris]|nr:hypothetical protein MPSEU_000427500 [Mayamaea pseudoterrestris]
MSDIPVAAETAAANIDTSEAPEAVMEPVVMDPVDVLPLPLNEPDVKQLVEESNDGNDNLMMEDVSGDDREEESEGTETKVPSRAREVRLDQNRKAARESRRRKKVMIEELQRSVIFFSRANSTLKLQNDEITRLLLHAQSIISQQLNDDAKAEEAAKEGGGGDGTTAAQNAALASNKNSNVPVFTSLPPMQPGATMQAMSNFQQAASMAMQQAMQGLQSIPGINMTQLTAAPAGSSAQQAYTDTMTALAMQQAVIAAAGTQHAFNMQQQQQQQQSGFPQAPFAVNPFMWTGIPQQLMPAFNGGDSNEGGGQDAVQGEAKQG